MPSDYPSGAITLVDEWSLNLNGGLRCGKCSALIATAPLTLLDYTCPICGSRTILEYGYQGQPNRFVTYPPKGPTDES